MAYTQKIDGVNSTHFILPQIIWNSIIVTDTN